MTKITYIPGEIANAAIDEHGNRKPVTRTHHIFDDAKDKNQAEVNAEVDDTFAFHQSEINALNSQNYVTVDSFSTLPATGAVDTVYRVSNWDGTQQDPSVYSEYAWNGSQYVHLSTKTQIGEVFDISAYHATGGELATYADLSAALAAIPSDYQKGGMSIKFVQSSDNKYVQYRLTSNSFNTTVSNWVSDDDVIEKASISSNYIKELENLEDFSNPYSKISELTTGNIYANGFLCCAEYNFQVGHSYVIQLETSRNFPSIAAGIFSSNSNTELSLIDENIIYLHTGRKIVRYSPTQNCNYLAFYCGSGSQLDNGHYISVKILESSYSFTTEKKIVNNQHTFNYENIVNLKSHVFENVTLCADVKLWGGTKYTIFVKTFGLSHKLNMNLFSTNTISELNVIDEISPLLRRDKTDECQVLEYTPTQDVQYLCLYTGNNFASVDTLQIFIISDSPCVEPSDFYSNTIHFDSPYYQSANVLADSQMLEGHIYRIKIKTNDPNLGYSGIFSSNDLSQISVIQENIVKNISQLPNISTTGYEFIFRPFVNTRYLCLWVDSSHSQYYFETEIRDITVEKDEDEPTYIICDGDLLGDIDDLFGLRYITQAEKEGKVILIGLNCSTRFPSIAQIMDGFLTNEGLNDVCIGIDKSDSAPSFVSDPNYVNGYKTAPHTYTSNDQAEDSLTYYKRLLKWIPANRKTILYTMGGYSAVDRLIFDTEGKNLLTQKVDKVWCCGGWFSDDPSNTEYNFNINTLHTTQFLQNCPVPIYICGFEVMGQIQVGQSLGGGNYAMDLLQKAFTYFNNSTDFTQTWERVAGDACVAVMVCNDNDGLSNITVTKGTCTMSGGRSLFTASVNGNHFKVSINYEYSGEWFWWFKTQINAVLTRLYQGHFTGNGKRFPRT